MTREQARMRASNLHGRIHAVLSMEDLKLVAEEIEAVYRMGLLAPREDTPQIIIDVTKPGENRAWLAT